MLTNLWVQDVEYKFPLLVKNEKRGLWFQHKWLIIFNRQAYLSINNGSNGLMGYTMYWSLKMMALEVFGKLCYYRFHKLEEGKRGLIV